MSRRILVTGATGQIGGAVAAQLLEQGVTTRAMVHRDDARSARLRELGAPTTHVRDVTGIEPEDFLTIARRYVTGPETRRTAVNFMRQVSNFMLTALTPMHRLDTFDRTRNIPGPHTPGCRANPRYGEVNMPLHSGIPSL